jgi:hypothetical protein
VTTLYLTEDVLTVHRNTKVQQRGDVRVGQDEGVTRIQVTYFLRTKLIQRLTKKKCFSCSNTHYEKIERETCFYTAWWFRITVTEYRPVKCILPKRIQETRGGITSL